MKKNPISCRLALFILFAFLFNACSSVTQNVTASVQATESPTFQPTSTSTPIPPTPTLYPINHLERICDEGWPISNDTSRFAGSLVYRARNGALLLDISSSLTEHIFKSVRYPDIAVSPKQDMLTTMEYRYDGFRISLQRIWIASQNKEFSLVFPETTFEHNFLDSQRILLRNDDELDKNYVGNGTTDKYYILSLGTERFTPDSVFLPNFSLREHEFGFQNDNYDPPWIAYSPDFKYVAYPIQQDWDKNSILNIESGDTHPFDWLQNFWVTPHPFWRPDSKALTILRTDDANSNYNYFDLSLNGQVEQLTRLEDVVKGTYNMVPSADWSPNSRYLSFPIYSGATDTGTIFILDTWTGNILDLCYSHPWPQGNISGVWSPDSKYLATYFGDDTQIVDFEDKTIFELKFHSPIPLDAFPLSGWVNWQTP